MTTLFCGTHVNHKNMNIPTGILIAGKNVFLLLSGFFTKNHCENHSVFIIFPARSLLPDPGFQILAARSSLPDPGFQILAT